MERSLPLLVTTQQVLRWTWPGAKVGRGAFNNLVAFYTCSLPAFQFLCPPVLICSSPSRRMASLLLGPPGDGMALRQPAASPHSRRFTWGGFELTQLHVITAAWSRMLPSFLVFLKRVAAAYSLLRNDLCMPWAPGALLEYTEERSLILPVLPALFPLRCLPHPLRQAAAYLALVKCGKIIFQCDRWFWANFYLSNACIPFFINCKLLKPLFLPHIWKLMGFCSSTCMGIHPWKWICGLLFVEQPTGGRNFFAQTFCWMITIMNNENACKKSQCLFVANVQIGSGGEKVKCLTDWLNYSPSGPALLSEIENIFFLQ